MLDLIDTTKSYAQGRMPVTAVRGVTLTVAPGEFVTIMGRAGRDSPSHTGRRRRTPAPTRPGDFSFKLGKLHGRYRLCGPYRATSAIGRTPCP